MGSTLPSNADLVAIHSFDHQAQNWAQMIPFHRPSVLFLELKLTQYFVEAK